MVTKKDKLLAAAQKFLERGALDKALVEFNKAVTEDPKDTRTWLRIAELHVKRGATDQATEVYLKTADLYVEQGFFQRAVAVYKNVLKLSPNYLDGHFKLAEIFKQLGLLSDAIGQYEHAAAAFQRTGRIKEAIGAMRQIVEINPEQVLSRIKLAEAASQAGEIEDAIAEFGKAAEQLLGAGRVDEYLRVAERLLFHQADNYTLAKAMAVKYIERNNARFALAKLQACFKADPRDPETLGLLARAFEQLGQTAKTISVLKELARVHSEAGNTAERNEVVQKILALDPNDSDAHEARQRPSYVAPIPDRPKKSPAITFTEMAVPQFMPPSDDLVDRPSSAPKGASSTRERISIASSMLERPEEEVAGDVNRIIAESDVFVKYGLTERAVEHLRKVFELVPKHPGAHERLAAVLLQLGRTKEAVAELEILAEQLAPMQPQEAATFAERALDLDPDAQRAKRVLEAISGNQTQELDESDLEMPQPTTGSGVPVLLESDEVFLEAPSTNSSRSLVETDEDLEMFNTPTMVTPLPRPLPRMEAEVELVEAAFDRVEDNESFAEAEHTVAQDMSEFLRVRRTTIEEGTAAKPAPEPEAQAEDAPAAVSDESLEEDLAQVDFFIDQEMHEDASALLDDLVGRFPGHPDLLNRFTRLDAAVEKKKDADAQMGVDAGVGALPDDSMDERTTLHPRAMPAVNPRAVVAGGGAADLNTHGDLGIAYKEMGLFDAAVKEFAILAQDPNREVFALTMMGECHEAKGAPAEAVLQYKKALNRPQITDAESTQLYYQLGTVFQTLGDKKEALYFFEKVAKREPGFRDNARRVAELRGGGGPAGAGGPGRPQPLSESGGAMDFDTVLTGNNRGGR